MSLILDALRKMEQERKSRRGAQLDIRPEVLRYRAQVKPPKPKPYLLAALGLVLVTGAIGGGMFLKGRQVAVASPATEATAPSAPSAPAPVASPAPGGALPAPAVSTPSSPPVSASAQPSASKPAGTLAAATKPARAATAGLPRPQPLPPDATEHPQAAPSDITISGIAWQDERRLRRAVLNDVLVGEGAEIAGARVLEIREDKVRLSRGGQVFEVLFSAALSSR